MNECIKCLKTQLDTWGIAREDDCRLCKLYGTNTWAEGSQWLRMAEAKKREERLEE